MYGRGGASQWSRYVSIVMTAGMVSVFSFAPTMPARAAITSKTANTFNLTSGQALVFASATQSFSNPASALTTSISNGTAKNFWINNSGTLGVNSFTMTITLPSNANISAFRRCNLNVSFTGSNTCASGTPTNLTMTSGVAKSYVLSLPANGFYSFQIVQNKTGSMTVSSTIFSSEIVATTSNS